MKFLTLSMAKAFAPGHITGFFQIFKNGSRGAGINLSLGARSKVRLIPSERLENKPIKNMEVYINGKRDTAPVTRLAIEKLVGEIGVIVETNLDLPIGQGFGMSCAGSLSATIALAHLLEMPKERAIEVSHFAEIQLATGLGDVVASAFGGIEMRTESGLNGKLQRIDGCDELVLCIIGEKMDTSGILMDHKNKNKKIISFYGRKCVDELIASPTIENFFQLSKKFAIKTGLASGKIMDAIDEAEKYGMASMCMLGNSIFAAGETENLMDALAKFGDVYKCKVDKKGARILNEK